MPTDFLGSTDPPCKFVFRQVCDKEMTVYGIDRRKACRVPCCPYPFTDYDPKTSLYMEPGIYTGEPFYNKTMPILITASPMEELKYTCLHLRS